MTGVQTCALPIRELETVKSADDMRRLVSHVFAEMFDEALDATNEQLNALADEVWTHCTSASRR